MNSSVYIQGLNDSRHSSTDDLFSDVAEAGIVTTTLGDLRQRIANVDRLGKHVLALIRQRLDANGIGYFPKDVLTAESPRQHHEVRLYVRDSEIGRVVEAVLNPSLTGDCILKEKALSAPGRSSAVDLEIVRNAVTNLETAGALLKDFLNEDSLDRG